MAPWQWSRLRISSNSRLWRTPTRAAVSDPHLGRKTACYFFVNLAVFLLLAGMTISVLDVMDYVFEPAVAAQQARKNGNPPPQAAIDPTTGKPLPQPAHDWFNDQQRTAAGLVVSGLVHGLLFFAIAYFGTNDRQFPAVRRAFVGLRLVLCLIVVMTASTAAIVLAFQRDDWDLKFVQIEIAVAAVWAPAALVHGALLLRSSGWRTRGRNEPAED